MSKRVGKLARRYARALVNAVQKELGSSGSPTPAEQVAKALEQFRDLWVSDRELSFGLLSPMFERDERKKALEAVARAAAMPEVVVRFLGTLCDRDRLGMLPEMVDAFVAFANEVAGLVKVEVVTASPVSDVETKEIESDLRQYIRGRPEFSWSVDRALLGGMVVKFGGKILDGSVSGKLSRLERSVAA